MFTKLERTKVFRDPLYGFITVDYKIIADLIDSREVQRLRRIRQLSGVSMVFQTAEHSRFTHSLGVYQMANLVCENVEGMDTISEYEKIVFLCSALLHDIGHGPYSHAFEHTTLENHENMTVKIILNPNTTVNKILTRASSTLASDIASVIAHDNRFPLIESLVSSQLDVDRMDYLSRDAYYTGTAYGHIDYLKILRSMKVVSNKLLVRASGVHSIESYLMSRYHMYFQVYFHPVGRAYECILESIYKRIKDLYLERGYFSDSVRAFLNVLNDSNDIESYIEIDDAYVNGFVKAFTKSEDPILNKLSNAFMDRHLFSYIDLNDEPDEDLVEAIKEKYDNENKKYFYYDVSVSAVAYLHAKKSEIYDIKVLLPNGKIKSLDAYSPIIKSLADFSKTIKRIYYFED